MTPDLYIPALVGALAGAALVLLINRLRSGSAKNHYLPPAKPKPVTAAAASVRAIESAIRTTVVYESGQFEQIVRSDVDSDQLKELAKLHYALRKQLNKLQGEDKQRVEEILKRSMQVARDTSISIADKTFGPMVTLLTRLMLEQPPTVRETLLASMRSQTARTLLQESLQKVESKLELPVQDA